MHLVGPGRWPADFSGTLRPIGGEQIGVRKNSGASCELYAGVASCFDVVILFLLRVSIPSACISRYARYLAMADAVKAKMSGLELGPGNHEKNICSISTCNCESTEGMGRTKSSAQTH